MKYVGGAKILYNYQIRAFFKYIEVLLGILKLVSDFYKWQLIIVTLINN